MKKNFVKIFQNFEIHPDLLPFILDNLILIRGSKGRSGLYLYNKTDNIDEVLLYAGRDGDKILQSPDRTVIDIYNDSIELWVS